MTAEAPQLLTVDRDEMSLLVTALRVAARLYDADSNVCMQTGESSAMRVGEQFARLAERMRALAARLDRTPK
jgi:hypothetical protein